MLALAGPLPPDDGAWAAEVKWDGYRVVAAVRRDGGVDAWSRNRLDVLGRYPPLAQLGALGRDLVLDGEVVAFDEQGRPSFGRLQRFGQEPATLAYVVFDLLHLDGTALPDQSYDERRALLEGLPLHETAPVAQVADTHPRPSELWEATKARGLEGVVCKRRTSRYEPGRRTGAWVKTKHILGQEVLVAGWKPGERRRAGRVGSLLLGVYDAAGALHYVGHVGTGFTDAALDELAALLAPLRRDSPAYDEAVPRDDARGAVWVEPRLVGQVEFTEWTSDGRMRHPSWKGLRDDKDPREVVRET
jgi:bifunctional non-homologous end joining protein LigD